MNIRQLVNDIEAVYAEMAKTFSEFQKTTSLPCLDSCGRCCQNPDIEASPLEMLPWALAVYDQGLAENWIEKLEASKQSHCLLLISGVEAHQGSCSAYNGRPSVCRMFGVAGYFNKQHQSALSICRYIREEHPLKIKELEEKPPKEIPMMAWWFQRVANLGAPDMLERVSINSAMLQALQKVSLYMQYQD